MVGAASMFLHLVASFAAFACFPTLGESLAVEIALAVRSSDRSLAVAAAVAEVILVYGRCMSLK